MAAVATARSSSAPSSFARRTCVATTPVEILEGYRERSGGDVDVLGRDPARRELDLRRRVGIVLQSSGMYRHITVREALEHWARLYPAPRDVDEVIDVAGLRKSEDV